MNKRKRKKRYKKEPSLFDEMKDIILQVCMTLEGFLRDITVYQPVK